MTRSGGIVPVRTVVSRLRSHARATRIPDLEVYLSRGAIRKAIVLCIAAFASALSPSLLRPDALVITRAMLATTISEIFIRADTVVVELEIGASDAQAFQNLMPDELYEALGNEPAPSSPGSAPNPAVGAAETGETR